MNEQEQEQRRIVRGGATTCLTWLVLIALIVAGYFWAQPLLRRLSVSPPGADVIVFADFRKIANELVWIGGFTVALVLAAVAVTKTLGRAAVAAGLVVIVVGFAFSQRWYAPIAAIRFATGDAIELQYLWPRPPAVVDASALRGLAMTDSLERADPAPNVVCRLEFQIGTQRFRSMWSDGTRTRDAHARLKQLQESGR